MLSLCTLKNKTKKFADFNLFDGGKFFQILFIHKPSLGPCEVPPTSWADRFNRFDVYWIQTNTKTQTPKHTSKVYRLSLLSYIKI